MKKYVFSETEGVLTFFFLLPIFTANAYQTGEVVCDRNNELTISLSDIRRKIDIICTGGGRDVRKTSSNVNVFNDETERK